MPGLFAFERSRKLAAEESFDSLLFALIRKADTTNMIRLRLVFPIDVMEVEDRYNLPGGKYRTEISEEKLPLYDEALERSGYMPVGFYRDGTIVVTNHIPEDEEG